MRKQPGLCFKLPAVCPEVRQYWSAAAYTASLSCFEDIDSSPACHTVPASLLTACGVCVCVCVCVGVCVCFMMYACGVCVCYDCMHVVCLCGWSDFVCDIYII